MFCLLQLSLIHLQLQRESQQAPDAVLQAWEIHSNYTNMAPSQQAHLFGFQ